MTTWVEKCWPSIPATLCWSKLGVLLVLWIYDWFEKTTIKLISCWTMKPPMVEWLRDHVPAKRMHGWGSLPEELLHEKVWLSPSLRGGIKGWLNDWFWLIDGTKYKDMEYLMEYMFHLLGMRRCVAWPSAFSGDVSPATDTTRGDRWWQLALGVPVVDSNNLSIFELTVVPM